MPLLGDAHLGPCTPVVCSHPCALPDSAAQAQQAVEQRKGEDVMTWRGLSTSAVALLLVVSGGCDRDECVCPQVPKAANVVFVDWICCGGSQECGLDNPELGAVGRVRNIGDQPAYHVFIDVRPCATCEAGGSFAGVDTLAPGQEHTFAAIVASPPGNCPHIRRITWSSETRP
jgi:hypothetical protein